MVFSFPLGFKAKQDFVEDSQKLYDSEPATLTDVNDINEWVKKVTNGHITEFLSSLPLSAVMMLINAMHYKGQNKHLLPASISQFPLTSVSHIGGFALLRSVALLFPCYFTSVNR